MSAQVQAHKNAAISAKILDQIKAGKTLQQAFDAVLGEGAYAKMAGELYEEMKAKAAAKAA
jgi:hypothetical protein